MGVKIMPSSNRTLTNGLQFLSMTAHMNMIGENVIHIVYPHMTLAARTIGPVHSRLHLANNFPHLTVLNGTSSHYECAEACHLGDRHALDDRSFQIPIGKQNKVRRLSRNIYYVDGLFCDYQHCPGDRRNPRITNEVHIHGALCWSLLAGQRVRETCMFGYT